MAAYGSRRTVAFSLSLLTALLSGRAAPAAVWSPLQLETGDARVVRQAPSDPNIVYAAGGGAGVFRSADGGVTWTKTSLAATYYAGNIDHAVALVVELAVSPLDANLVYALIDGGVGAVYRTTNGGTTWSLVRSAGSGENFLTMAMAPGTPSTLFVAGLPGVLIKTTDGGSTWATAATGLPAGFWPRDLAVDPGDANTAYLAIVSLNTVYKTTNGGGSWTLASSGLMSGTSRLTIDPGTPTTIFAETGDGVYRTTDGAATWLPRGSGLPSEASAVAIDPNDSSTVYAAVAGDGIYRSGGGGAAWSLLSADASVQAVRWLEVRPGTANTLLVGTRSGPARSVDAGTTWTPTVAGFTAARVQALAVHPSDPDIAYAGTDYDLFKTSDGGATWSATGLVGTGAEDILIDVADPSIVYAVGFGVHTSTDAGATWTASPLTGSFFGLARDPGQPATLYAAGATGLYKSTDAAASWTLLGGGLPPGEANSVAVDPADSNVIYAGTPSGVYRSADGGAAWTDVWPFPSITVADLFFDPAAALYAAVPNVARTTNGGSSWSFLSSGGGSVFDLGLDPIHSTDLYLARTTGFARLATTGGAETVLDAGLPAPRIALAVAVVADGRGVLGGRLDGLFRLQPVCGDGVAELGEACDDGNTNSGDCCAAACDSAAANGFACSDGLYCNGLDSCQSGACAAHTGDPCAAGAPCNTACNEAGDSCFNAAASPCPDDGDPCSPPACDGAGTCVQGDADGDGLGDLCDNCPTAANLDQANADCADPTYLIDTGCADPASDRTGCCDGGDLCDACPAQGDNTACNAAGTVAVSVGPSGGSASAADGSTALAIPPGALADPTTITLTPNGPATSFALQDASVLSLSARPAGLQFLVPAHLTITWADRDADGLVDRGRCLGSGSEPDFELSCDADGDCTAGDCTVDASLTSETELVLKRDGQRFAAGGFDAGPFRCVDHVAGACAAAVADCSDAPGTGQATVAGCCDPVANTWTFQTCSFSEFFLGRTAGDLVPGKGSAATDCIAEWGPGNPLNVPYLDKQGLPNTEQTCADGDASCDQDGLPNGVCAFALTVCLNVDDARLRNRDGGPACASPGVAQVVLKKPRPDAAKSADAANGVALRTALAALAPSSIGGSHGEVVSYAPTLAAADQCTTPATVTVPLKSNGAAGKLTLKLQALNGAAKDADKLKLVCQPAAP